MWKFRRPPSDKCKDNCPKYAFSLPFLVDHESGEYISATNLDPFHLTPARIGGK